MFTRLLLEAEHGEAFNPSNHEEPLKYQVKEANALRSIIEYLNWQQMKGKLFFSRINTTGIYDEQLKRYRTMSSGTFRGFPDIIVVANALPIFIEVKSHNGKQSTYQVAIEAELTKQGAVYILARTASFVEQRLSKYLDK